MYKGLLLLLDDNGLIFFDDDYIGFVASEFAFIHRPFAYEYSYFRSLAFEHFELEYSLYTKHKRRFNQIKL